MRLPFLQLFITAALAFPVAAQTLHTFHHENVLGTSLELKIAAASETIASQGEAAALAEIDRLAGILSSYDANSEFRRWAATRLQTVAISPELFEVLGLFDQWRNRTHGALDAAAQEVIEARQSASPAELSRAVARVRQQHWALDGPGHTATHLSTAALRLNSFAKSYIVEHAAEAVMRQSGVAAVVVNIGGDLVVKGAWTETVHVADPRNDAENTPPLARLTVTNRAVATSGTYRRGTHIVDPRTGQAVDHVIGATAIAPHGVDAGALATAMIVLPVAQSRRLAATIPGVEFLLMKRDGGVVTSKGWRALTLPDAPVIQSHARPDRTLAFGFAAQTGAASWNPGLELVIQLELARVEDPRYRRPYVAVWLEDKDRFPVRTLALWLEKPRWLPDLKSWYRGDRMRALAEGNDITASVSSATRAPGRYTLKWDGKDNQGKLVKPGKYTVVIEAAREHGTYQVMRQQMDFNGTPSQMQLPGNTELKGATLDYKRIANR